MKIEVRARRSGKTYDMILRACGTEVQIVCFSILECQRVMKMAKQMEADIIPPISFQKYLNNRNSQAQNEIFIDNLDLCLSYVTGYKRIGLVTMSSND